METMLCRLAEMKGTAGCYPEYGVYVCAFGGTALQKKLSRIYYFTVDKRINCLNCSVCILVIALERNIFWIFNFVYTSKFF